MGWYYRARRKRCPQMKEWVYDVVEWFGRTRLPIGKPYKTTIEQSKILGEHKVVYYKKYKQIVLWSSKGETPMSMNKRELIETLRMMLNDVIKHKTFTDKDDKKEKSNG